MLYYPNLTAWTPADRFPIVVIPPPVEMEIDSVNEEGELIKETITVTPDPYVEMILLPPNIEQAWTAEQLREFELYKAVAPEIVPPGKVMTNEVEWNDEQGVIYKLADAPAESIDSYKDAIVALLDSEAQQRRYDNAVAISTYVNSTIPAWKAEAETFVSWRDAVWLYTYAELDKVLNGQRPQPSVEDFVAELPPLVWPA